MPSATVTLLLLAFGPSLSAPGRLGMPECKDDGGDEGSMSDIEVGVAV